MKPTKCSHCSAVFQETQGGRSPGVGSPEGPLVLGDPRCVEFPMGWNPQVLSRNRIKGFRQTNNQEPTTIYMHPHKNDYHIRFGWTAFGYRKPTGKPWEIFLGNVRPFLGHTELIWQKVQYHYAGPFWSYTFRICLWENPPTLIFMISEFSDVS